MSQKTILIRSVAGGPIQKETIMDAAVLPGMLVERASSTRIQVLSATLDPTMQIVVESNDTQFDGTYDSGALVPYITPARGDEVYAYATASALSTLAVTNYLVSDGAGFLVYAASPLAGEAIAKVISGQVIAANAIELVKVEVL